MPSSARRRSRPADRKPGTVVTLRDHTELQALSGELDSVRGFTESLRSQAHEAANRLHAVVSLIELGRTHEGLSVSALDADTAVLRQAEGGLSAGAAAAAAGVSRITARRYLEHLVVGGLATREPQYGQVGRPELCYRWQGQVRLGTDPRGPD